MARTNVRERGLRRLFRKLKGSPCDDFDPYRGGWPGEGDDGSAGVREPRRPVHPPSDLVAREPLPPRSAP